MVVLAGLDGTKAGWIAAFRDVGSTRIAIKGIDAFAPWAATLPRGSIAAIDIPIGLGERTEAGGRACERAARAFLGREKSSSVFSTPSRRAVQAETWEKCCAAVQRDLPDRRGVSKQAWNIFPKIREIDAAIAGGLCAEVRESHPEMAFAIMNGGRPVIAPKKSGAGRETRLRLLKKVSVDVAPFLSQRPTGCAADDLIDAFACLWVAERIHAKEATCHGDTVAGHPLIWA